MVIPLASVQVYNSRGFVMVPLHLQIELKHVSGLLLMEVGIT